MVHATSRGWYSDQTGITYAHRDDAIEHDKQEAYRNKLKEENARANELDDSTAT